MPQPRSRQRIRKDFACGETAARRLERFAKSLQDGESAVGKALQSVENGVGHAQRIARHYNKVAPWCGLPSVPEQFLGSDSEG